MKKTLLAAALIAGYAGAASAQNSVTLYGVIDVGVAYQTLSPGAADRTNTSTRSNFGMASGQQSGSRWGLKGVEDLGDGLKANFVLEAGVDITNGTNAIGSGFARQATLGLTSDKWGGIDLGRTTAPSTQAFAGIDPFGAGFGTAALTTTIGTNFIRYNNMVMYSTPTVAGFKGMIGYAFDVGANNNNGNAFNANTTNGNNITGAPDYASGAARYGTTNKTRALSVGLRYANGPVLLAATWDNYQPAAWKSTTYTRGAAAATPTTLRTGTFDSDAKAINTWALGGTYDLKVVKIAAAFSQSIDGIVNGTSTLQSIGTGGDTNTTGGIAFVPGARTNSWMLGATVPVGTGSVFASVQQKLPGGNLRELDTANELAASIGYTYPFSKRTNLYAYYSYLNNVAMVSGAKANTVGLGLRHLF